VYHNSENQIFLSTKKMPALFGGAIHSDFPATYEDVSYFRQLPDNEEVFVESSTDACLVLEILDFSANVADGDIAEFQFTDIAESNESLQFTVEEKGEVLVGNGKIWYCGGVQNGVVKFRERETRGNDIYVWVGVLRLPEHTADLVLSVTAPIRLSAESSSFVRGSIPDVARGKQVFLQAIATLTVTDYNLFA